jgi:anti-sigma regulatory factor (Ser/Thr protein kinase)
VGALTGPLLLDCEDVAWLRQDPSLPTSARRTAAALAGRLGMTAARVSEVELAVTEAATNLNRHAADGALLFRILRTPQVAALELLVVDSGPGMADVAGSLVDGVSTAGTLGIGLGVLARMADAFGVHSLPGRGTVLVARFWAPHPADGGKPPVGEPAVAGMTRPISGEEVCGDAWAARLDEAGPAILVMLCDGLGHGPLAAAATARARAAILRSRAGQPEEILRELHAALAGSRGAAAAVARIEPATKTVRYCGIGNTSGFVVTHDTRSALLSAPGIVGHQMPRLRVFEQPLPEGSALILHSDGLTERWSPRTLPGLLRHGPAVIAGQLLREAGIRRDDASVAVAKGYW